MNYSEQMRQSIIAVNKNKYKMIQQKLFVPISTLCHLWFMNIAGYHKC